MLFLAQAAATPHSNVALDLLLILAAAAGAAMILRRVRLTTIPSFLITGAILGSFGLISDTSNVESISELALIMLMFTIGLHMDPGSLSGGMIHVLGVGVVATIGGALAMWPLVASGIGAPRGLAIAMALSMSSTAVVVRILQQQRELHKIHGRLIFGVLVVQDLLALAILAVLPLLAAWAGVVKPAGSGADVGAFLLPTELSRPLRALFAMGGMGVLILGGRLVLPRLLQEAAKNVSAEVPLVLAAATALGAAIVTQGLGFSPELGAFIAGFILATTPFRHQLAGQLTPLRDLFMAVFFTTVGLKLNVKVVQTDWPLILMGLVSVIVVKAAVTSLVSWIAGATAPVSVRAGLALAQAGEFTIVILAAASSQNLIDATVNARLIAVVILSLMVTPLLYNLGIRLRPLADRIPIAGWSRSTALRETAHAAAHSADPSRRRPATDKPPIARYAVVAGFGIVGRSIADRLEVAGVPFCIVDLNQQTIATQRRLGRRAVYGDITNPEVLESADVHSADAVILTIPDDEATLRACRTVREAAPETFIAARTSFLSKAMAATELGADHVVVEEVATAEAMAKQVIERLSSRKPPRV